jgi:GT2 family glycosyltransferase
LAPPRVAVVTPYFTESLEMLRLAHDSVLAQTHPCRHILVADGRPKPEVEGWDADHIALSYNHGDYGSTPGLVGAAAAAFQGCDLIAFLDSDNWYREDHVQTVVELHQRTGAAFVSTSRMLCRLDGSLMAPCPTTDPERFVDTNCWAFAREAFPLLTYGVTLPDYAQIINDRCLYQHVLASGVARAHSPKATVFYRCGKAGIYRLLGEPVPPGVVPAPDYAAAFARWAAEGRAPLI